MKKFILIVFTALLGISIWGQKTGSIKGIIFDTLTTAAVPGATITLLQKSDSSLVSFTMTNNAGVFTLTGISYGKYRLMVTHVNYHNTNKYFSIGDLDRNIDLGLVIVNDKNRILEEVVLQVEAPPVTLVGDTIQYNAGSFKTKPNAVVEDL